MSAASPSPLLRGRLPVLVALLVVVAVVVVDVLVAATGVAVTSLMIGAPLLCGLTSTTSDTWRVGALASAVAAAAFIWGPALGSWRYWVPLAVVVLGSAFAIVMAIFRQQMGRDAHRMRVLADVAGIAHGGQPVEEIARALADLLVPRLADLCAIDMIGADGRLHRLAAVAIGPSGPASQLLGRSLGGNGDGDEGPGPPPSTTVHHPAITDGELRELARDPDELRLLTELKIESAIATPLAPRGEPLGTLLLGTRSPRRRLARPDDVEYAETLAGRVGLALDNAALSAELSSAEQQLQVILASVDAAVTVRDRNGRMVYANQAAADLLKLPDPEAVLAQPPGGHMGRFDVYTEDGVPVDLTDLAGTRLLMGKTAPEAMTVRNVVKATGEERWLLNKATAVTAPDGRVLMAVNLIEDITTTKRNEIAQHLLAQTARTLAEAGDLSDTMQAIADAAVPSLADWAGVELVDQAGRIRTYAIAHRDPDKVRLGWRLRARWPAGEDERDGLAAVIRTGEPQLLHDISDEMIVRGAQDAEHLAILREVGLNSAMIAPIRAGERILGALSFVSSTSRRFDERDLELACDLGRQAGIVIDSAELHAAQTHIAQTLQAGLIPRSLPPIAGWELSSAYRAAGRANEVGGDFYDVVQFDGGWVAIIGDVVGKGAEAAALTALARHTLAAIVESTGDMGHALQVLNRRLRQQGADYHSLCTVAAIMVQRDDQATVFTAGHPLPLLRHNGAARTVGRPSPMLGFVDDGPIVATTIEIEPGDQLVLYTDGVLDAIGADERFGETRLLQTVQRLVDGTPSHAQQILEAIDGFQDRDQNDDIAIMTLSRMAGSGDRPPSA
jgi:serine phosphatase RsbU (regulator of sigma subunit)/PAS domain-containing protein